MTAVQSGPDTEAEREIDLVALGRGLLRLWWIVALGVVIGAIVGGFYSLSGGHVYEATARIAPGQAFNPSGSSPVLTYLTSQGAINEIATSENAIEVAAAAAGISPARLRGRVSTAAVNQNTNAATAATSSQRNAVLVNITVRLNRKKQAEDAANAIADYVRTTTTSRYVRKSLAIYGARIKSFNTRLKTLQQRVDALTLALKQPGLSLSERLLIAIQLDQAQATQGQTIDTLSTTEQQQILAQDVELTKLVQDARGTKSTARSRRSSIVVGAILGFIVGLGVAVVVHYRGANVQPA